jgi:hypothetical protein
MDNNTIQQIKDTIAQSQSIGVAAPKDPTLDEMAAALSLYLLLKNVNKQVSVASPTDPIVELSSLVGIDKVQKTLAGSGGGSGDLTVSFPYTEGEIEKVSYTLEEGYLNIIVKAAEQGLSFDEKDVEYTRGGGGKLDLVFTVGVARLSDLDPLFDTQNPDTRIVNIDNKAENEQYGDINVVSAKLSSVSEGVADLAMALGLHIDQDSAQNLLSGVIEATQNFQSPSTSSLAFEMSALLMKKGAARVSSDSARRNRVEDRPQAQIQARPQAQPLRQPAQRKPQDAVSTSPADRQDKREADRQRFEENLQRRVAEEKAREARSAGQAPQARQSMPQPVAPVNDDFQDDVATDDEAPNDWLAPKVYKGSSEV